MWNCSVQSPQNLQGQVLKKRSKISWSGSPDIIGAPGRPGRPGRPGSNMGLATLGRPSRASLLFVTVARLVNQCDVTAMFWGWHCPKHALKKAGNFSTKGHKNNVNNHSHHLWWNYEVDLWIIEGIYSSCMLGIEAGSRRWCKTSDEYVLCLSTQSSNWTKVTSWPCSRVHPSMFQLEWHNAT